MGIILLRGKEKGGRVLRRWVDRIQSKGAKMGCLQGGGMLPLGKGVGKKLGPVCADRRSSYLKPRIFSWNIYLARSQVERSPSYILSSLLLLLVLGAVRRAFLKFWVDPVVRLNVLQCLCFPRAQCPASLPSPLSLQLGSMLRAKPAAQLPWKDLPLLLLSLWTCSLTLPASFHLGNLVV